MGPRVLFVCIGNICRSPMAEGIARALFGNLMRAESAGIAATTNTRPSEDAVLVMKSFYQEDISRHRARSLDAVRLMEFDYVIALDNLVTNRIRDAGVYPAGRLLGWDIEDPIGLGRDAYERAARKIEARLKEFMAGLGLEA